MLISILIAALVICLIMWVSGYLPAPFGMIVRVIAAVIFIIWLLQLLGVLSGSSLHGLI